jgi:hypothetical protein
MAECPVCQRCGCRAGASGAAVVDITGGMVGLVTSNARHTASQRLVQHLNFAIPSQQLRPVFSWADQPPTSRTVSSLAALDVRGLESFSKSPSLPCSSCGLAYHVAPRSRPPLGPLFDVVFRLYSVPCVRSHVCARQVPVAFKFESFL